MLASRRAWIAAVVVTLSWVVLAAVGVGAQEPGSVGEPHRFSTMGEDGDVDSRADSPAVAYNSVDDEYLVVWFGNDGVIGGDRNRRHLEVYGQRIDATTGEEVGEDDFRISFVGDDTDNNIFAGVTVTHNPEANEYLVAWLASATTTNPPFRVRVRRIDGASGELLGEQKILSDYETLIPSFGIDVVYNPNEDEYLVVWAGTDDSPDPPIVRFEYEVYGQRIDAEANEVGPSKFRISEVMGDGRIENANVEVFDTRVALDPAANEYLVVWDALAFIGQQVLAADLDLEQYYSDQEYEMFGQRLDAQGNQIGENDFLISSVELPGPPPEPLPAEMTQDEFDEVFPSRSDVLRGRVVHNPNRGEYLVVWSEDGEDNGLAEREFEVFARRIASDGTFASDKFRITDHGPPGEATFFLLDPNVVHDPALDHYLVTYSGPDPAFPPLDIDARIEENGPIFVNQSEVFGVWLDGDGTVLYDGGAQLTQTGPSGDAEYDAYRADVAHLGQDGEFAIVWTGNDVGMGTGDVEFADRTQKVYEIDVFGTRIAEPVPPPPPTTTTAPTTTTTAPAATTPDTTAPDVTTAPTGTTAPGPAAAESDSGSGGGGSAGLLIGIGVVAVAAIGGGILLSRRRSGSTS